MGESTHIDALSLSSTPLRCPHCRGELKGVECADCGRPVEIADGIPVLVADYEAVQSAITEAERAGKEAWYSEEQDVQFTGPYRHHVAKRRAYVASVLGQRGPFRTGVDIGCGDGQHLSWLSAHVEHLYGSDYNLRRLRRAQARGLGTIFLADVGSYPAGDDSFELVFFHHVLEHIPDDLGALREIHRILAPGGIVILGTPNEGAAFWRLAYRLEPRSRETTDHVHFYTAETLAERCRAAGFQIHEIHHIGWGLPHWGLDSRVRGSKLVDDVFEAIGSRFLRSQATSLYAILGK